MLSNGFETIYQPQYYIENTAKYLKLTSFSLQNNLSDAR